MPNSARSQVCRLQTQCGWTGRGWSGPAGAQASQQVCTHPALHTTPAQRPCTPALYTQPSPAHPPCTRSAQQPCTPNLVLHTQLCTPNPVLHTQLCTPTLHTQPSIPNPAHQTSRLLCTPDISCRRWYPKRRPRGAPTALSTTTGHSPRKGPDPGGPRAVTGQPPHPSPYRCSGLGGGQGGVLGIQPSPPNQISTRLCPHQGPAQ